MRSVFKSVKRLFLDTNSYRENEMHEEQVYPDYSRNERIADGVIHVLGLAFAGIAIALMITYTAYGHSAGTIFIVSVYATAMLLMLSCSAAYHMIPYDEWKGLLRRFDQSAIFLKIAGTYTPFAVLKMGGVWGYGLFGTVWAVALVGIGLILGLRQKRSNAILLLYLALGWAGVMVIVPLISSLSASALWLILAGGILYSVGTIFYVFYYLPFANVVWHGFVLAATVCHYLAVYNAVLIDIT